MSLFDLKELLSVGDLRSDGNATEVSKIVLDKSDSYFEELFECLSDESNIIRGHVSDALEKVVRKKPSLLKKKLEILLQKAKKEQIAMVKWHYAMIFSYMIKEINPKEMDEILIILFQYLSDESAFVISWSISSLTIIGTTFTSYKDKIIDNFSKLDHHPSKAVQSRYQKAKGILLQNNKIPNSWLKN